MQRTEKFIHFILLCHYAYTELEELMDLFIQLYQWKTANLRCEFVHFIVHIKCIQCMITHYVNFFFKDVRPVTHFEMFLCKKNHIWKVMQLKE